MNHINETVKWLRKAEIALLVECKGVIDCRFGVEKRGDCKGCRVDALLEQLDDLRKAVRLLEPYEVE